MSPCLHTVLLCPLDCLLCQGTCPFASRVHARPGHALPSQSLRAQPPLMSFYVIEIGAHDRVSVIGAHDCHTVPLCPPVCRALLRVHARPGHALPSQSLRAQPPLMSFYVIEIGAHDRVSVIGAHDCHTVPLCPPVCRALLRVHARPGHALPSQSLRAQPPLMSFYVIEIGAHDRVSVTGAHDRHTVPLCPLVCRALLRRQCHFGSRVHARPGHALPSQPLR